MPHALSVRRIYEAFGRGDVPAILTHLADDVEWEYGSGPTAVPWLQPPRGRAQVAGFFESLGAIDFHAFQPPGSSRTATSWSCSFSWMQPCARLGGV